MFTEVLLRGHEGELWPGLDQWDLGRTWGAVFWGAKGRVVMSSLGGGDTKEPVCPQPGTCLAFPRSELTGRGGGPGRKGAFLLAQSLGCPSLPASSGSAWCSGSLLQGSEMTIPTLEL